MYVVVGNKYNVFDIKAHEEMIGEKAEIYFNKTENKWAVKISGKLDHGFPIALDLGEGWVIWN